MARQELHGPAAPGNGVADCLARIVSLVDVSIPNKWLAAVLLVLINGTRHWSVGRDGSESRSHTQGVTNVSPKTAEIPLVCPGPMMQCHTVRKFDWGLVRRASQRSEP
jgi:hypothetical protein